MIHYKNESGFQSIILDINENNSFDLDVFKQLDEILEKAKSEKSKVLVLRSHREKVFSTGLNLAQLSGNPTDAILQEFMKYFFGILEKIYTYPTPVIAEVSGHAMGYGAMLALASDFRFGLEGMRFGLPEVKIGIGVPSFIIMLLSDIIGKQKASDHILWGNAYKTTEAHEIGLFHELFSESTKLNEAVDKYASKISKNSIQAMITTKYSLRRLNQYRSELIQNDILTTLSSIQSEDAKEGISATVQGRRPEFKF
jgi:enoyl-CoA hydratase/carnithine racemase